jgi:serine/threonine-protein kinase
VGAGVTALDAVRAALADRYAVARELGQGGMATVYLAEDLKHHRKVAVKVLRPELAAALGAERFTREIEIGAQLQHPHVLPLLDSGEAGGVLYYVMPYVDGESLRERLVRVGELPVHEAVKLLCEIVDALSHAHSRGVVHRDIKPDNVMLSGRHALVMDFGVAKAVSEATGRQQLTTAGVALGTPAYMAPEQATADPHLDHRVDIYAVGALAYELLAGRPPFTATTPQQVLAAHVTQAPEPVSTHRPGLSPALTAVVMKCLAKRPADRWQTADELLAQLEPLVTPSGGMTPAETRPFAAARKAPPRWLAWLVGGALVSAGAFAWSQRHHETAALTLGKRTAVAISAAWEWHPSLSPDGRLVSYTINTGTGPALAVQQVDGGAPILLPGGGARQFSSYSPDGTKLLFLSDSTLELAPALGGQSRTLVQDPSVGWAAWSPDGGRIAASIGDTLFTLPLDGGPRKALAGGDQLHSPAWSRDGEWIAYVLGNVFFHVNGNAATSAIWLVRADGGSPIRMTGDSASNLCPVWLADRRTLVFISDRDGGRDVYQQELTAAGLPSGPPLRLTTGLNPEWISLSADGRRLAWSVVSETANVWSIPIPARDSVALGGALPVTSGSQSIENFSISRDGRYVYFDSDRGGVSAIWRQPLAGGEPQVLTTGSDASFNPAVSPDGREVAFHAIRNGNRDILVAPAGGGQATVVSATPDQEYNPRWAPDGRSLTWDVQGVVRRQLMRAVRNETGRWGGATPVGKEGSAADWSPDGAVLANRIPTGIGLTDVATGQQHELVVDPRASWPRWSTDGRTIYYTTSDSAGRFLIRSVARNGGSPHTVAYATSPLLQAHRFGFGVTADRLYFGLSDRKADVWVAEVERQ